MNALNGFNRIAPWYDFLKRIVFGSSILRSQLHFLSTLPQSGTVLVLGGGSGELLPPLLRDRGNLHVVYVEASSAMLTRAREKISPAALDKVEFIHGTHDSMPTGVLFDGVVTAFFLDLFEEAELNGVCERIAGQLKENGVWLVSDFVDQGKWWQRVMLWIMYRFFVLTARISATKLPAWEQHLETHGFRQVAIAQYYGGFIRTAVCKKAVGRVG